MDIKTKDRLRNNYDYIIKKYIEFGLNKDSVGDLFNIIIDKLSKVDISQISDNFNLICYQLLNKRLLANENEFIDHVNDILKISTDYRSALIELRKLERLFKSFHLDDNYLAIDLVVKKSQVLPEILDSFIKPNETFFISKYIELDNNSFFSTLVEVYCSSKNITIKEDIVGLDGIYGNSSVENGDHVGDSLRMYMIELAQIPLLTHEQQYELAIRYKNGDEEAKKIMCERNLRLVVSMAFKLKKNGMDVIDLIQEGNMGLIKAIERFDPTLGFKFSSYATWWIRQNITRYISLHKSLIRVPVHFSDKQEKLKVIIDNFMKENGYLPSDEELASIMNLNVEEIRNLQKYSHTIVSGDQPLREETDKSILDFVPDDERHETENIVFDKVLKEEVLRAIHLLDIPIIYRKIFMLRYGLIDGKEHKLEDIGSRYGISRERARQLINKIENELKKHPNIRKLKNFREDKEDELVLDLPLKVKKEHSMDKPKSLLDYFPGIEPNDIIDACSKLSEEEQQILFDKFGPRLDEKSFLVYENNDPRIGKIIRELKKVSFREQDITIYKYAPKKNRTRLMVNKDIPKDIIEMHNDKVREIIECYDEDLKTILTLRLGFVNNNFYSEKTIARFMRITPEEVRIIVERAIIDLRHILKTKTQKVPREDYVKVYEIKRKLA